MSRRVPLKELAEVAGVSKQTIINNLKVLAEGLKLPLEKRRGRWRRKNDGGDDS